MSVNVSIRNYALSIGGLNCTTALMEFSGSDSKLDQSGLVIFTGSMKLGRPVGFESLDDRLNSRWARAAPILFDVANDANTLTRAIRFGTLFISDALYDRAEENSGRLNIQCTDLLGLLSNKQGDEGDAPKACVGEGGTSALAAINQLLALAGVPAPLLVTDPIPGNINAPVNGGGGYIQQAGAIAASQGWFLYVDGTTGQIRARSIDVDQVTPLYSLSVQDSATQFTRLPDRPPAQKMVVNGTGRIVTPVPQTNVQTVSRTYGNSSLIGGDGNGGELLVRERYNSETIVGSVRTVTVEVNEALGSLFPDVYPDNGGRITAERYTEVHTYESQSPVTSGGGDCENGNRGRLLSTVITSRKCFGVAFKGLVEVARNPDKLLRTGGSYTSPIKSSIDPNTGQIVGAPFSLNDLENLVEEYTEIIRYEYTPPETLTGRSLGRGPLITRKKITKLGILVPDYFSGKSYRPVWASLYNTTATAETEREFWWQENTGEWRYEHTLRQSQILKNEGDVARSHEAQKKRSQLPGAAAAGLGQVNAENYANLVTVEESVTTNRQNTPPAPIVLPPKYTIEEKDASASYQLPQDANWDYRDRSQVLSFDYLSGNTVGAVNAQAYYLARIHGVLGWGRYRGSQVSGAMSSFLLSVYRPADMVAADEWDFVSHNLADGFAVGMAGGELVVSLDLMYIGRVNPPLPPANQIILTLDGLRSIPPAARFDGQIGYTPG